MIKMTSWSMNRKEEQSRMYYHNMDVQLSPSKGMPVLLARHQHNNCLIADISSLIGKGCPIQSL
jgi:hypothetical protein